MFLLQKKTVSILLIGLLFLACKNETEEIKANSVYITDVFEYVYAPGQHASLAKATDVAYFKGDPAQQSKWLYLGGFGGYITAGFDHDIVNREGFDFEVYALSGSAPEPALAYVMPDENGDGKPNETWYELKGNQFENSKRNYWLRYYKPSGSANVKWLDSEGLTGELVSGFGGTTSAAWWWSETKTDSITFAGTRLPDSYENNPVNGAEYWTVPVDKFTWGYAENINGTDFEKSSGANKLDISNAVDANGNPIHLQNIRFIKIQTGVFQQAGWTNEVSAEVRGAKALE